MADGAGRQRVSRAQRRALRRRLRARRQRRRQRRADRSRSCISAMPRRRSRPTRATGSALRPAAACTVVESFRRDRDPTGSTMPSRSMSLPARHCATSCCRTTRDPAIHLSHRRIKLAKGTRYEGFTLTLGASLSRQDTHVAIEGEAAHCAVNGAYLLRRNQESTIVDADRSRRAGERDARGLQGRRRRPRARRLPGQDPGPPGGAEDQCASAQPQSSAEPARRGRHQARARDLRRRRQVQPRRDGRRSRRGRALLSASAAACPRPRRGAC